MKAAKPTFFLGTASVRRRILVVRTKLLMTPGRIDLSRQARNIDFDNTDPFHRI